MLKAGKISEEELVQKCKKGDLKYLEKLYKHFYGYAMGVSLRYLSDREDALEVVNDAFIKVFGSISTFNSKTHLNLFAAHRGKHSHRPAAKKPAISGQADLEEASYVGIRPRCWIIWDWKISEN